MKPVFSEQNIKTPWSPPTIKAIGWFNTESANANVLETNTGTGPFS